MKSTFMALLRVMVLFSPDIFAKSSMNIFGCNLSIPDGFDASYRSDGSITFMYSGSSVNVHKFGGHMKGGRVGVSALEVTNSRLGSLFVAEAVRTNIQTGMATKLVAITDENVELTIIGPLADRWKYSVRDCD